MNYLCDLALLISITHVLLSLVSTETIQLMIYMLFIVCIESLNANISYAEPSMCSNTILWFPVYVLSIRLSSPSWYPLLSSYRVILIYYFLLLLFVFFENSPLLAILCNITLTLIINISEYSPMWVHPNRVFGSFCQTASYTI